MGREYVMTLLRKTYWIIGGNSTCRKLLRNCVTCRKVNGRPGVQLMSELPVTRIDGDVPPFTHTGLDCFGPFAVSLGRKSYKRYGVIFTCMSSRAVHIEVASNLSTDSFINSLRRFICRRGNVRTITCDNGTNFVGAAKELRDALKDWNSSQIAEILKQRNIEWYFNTPTASHHGGAFEREIRSVRKTLASMLATQPVKLNDDELCTLLCEVEAILNNRPLTEFSSSPQDFTALTPNHLLLLENAVTFPPGLFHKDEIYARRRWKQVQYLSDVFWKRWKNEYMWLLQQRQKWSTEQPNFEVDNLVLVMDQSLPRNEWPLGRVVEVKNGRDNKVRSCKIRIQKTKSNFETTLLDRPIVKLIKLL